jgi:hypothetical protein
MTKNENSATREAQWFPILVVDHAGFSGNGSLDA